MPPWAAPPATKTAVVPTTVINATTIEAIILNIAAVTASGGADLSVASGGADLSVAVGMACGGEDPSA